MWFGGGNRDRGSNPLVLVALIAGAILAPVAAMLIQMAISRKREYVADASAVELTRYPQGLASALRTISGNATPSSHLANGAIAHLMIAAPLGGRGKTSTLFSTHPPIEDRIDRLDAMAGGQLHKHGLTTAARREGGGAVPA